MKTIRAILRAFVLTEILLASLPSALSLHTERQQLFDEQLSLLLNVHRIAADNFYNLYAGCYSHPYGRCPYDISVYTYPGFGRTYPYLQHYLQYNRHYYYP